MDLYDLRHCTKEETMEFKVVNMLTDVKKIHFREGEAVSASEAGGLYVIGSTDVIEKVVQVEPANEHYKNLLEDLFASGSPYLASVRDHASKLLQVTFKLFSEEKTINYSIHVSDVFLESVRNTVNLADPRNVRKCVEEGTLYLAGGYTYAVVGRHLRADDKNKIKHFIIVGRDFYIRVVKKVDKQGTEYYSAEKILKNIKMTDYRFFLARGKLKYTGEQEVIAHETKEILETLSDDTYIRVWDRYGEIEQEMIISDARDMEAIRYISYERDGYEVRFDISDGQYHRLKKYANKYKKNAVLSACVVNPFADYKDNYELSEFFRKHRDKIANITLTESIIIDNGYIRCRTGEDDIRKLSHGQGGYIFVSIDGDMRRIKRRKDAREKIESATCSMPNLPVVLEGKSVNSANARERHYHLSSEVRDEIFPEFGPYDMQEMAIEKALNTPDIMLIQGPPGTGKTTVITAILKSLNEITDPTGGIFGRNLVTAFQHDAVQNAIDRIEILGLPAIKFGHKYSESEDDIVDVNVAIHGWINNRLTDLHVEHTGIEEHKKIVEFNKLFLNYVKSVNSIEQTLDILEKVRDLVADRASSAILEELSENISDLQLLTGGTEGNSTKNLVRAIRRIPASEVAFEDNGWWELENAIRLLKKNHNPAFDDAIKLLEEMQNTEQYDYEELAGIRKSLLVKVIPKENIFTTAQKKESIIALLSKIMDYLMQQEASGKNGSDLVVAEYIQNLEEDPLAVKEAILHYTSVNGATNQQVMRNEIRDLKGGEIEYENVLVDEAARSNPLDLFIPLSIAKDRIILVGDHRQLPHIIEDKIANAVEEGVGADFKAETRRQLDESMFGILFKRLQQLEAQDGIKRTITLNKQFRMHPELGTFVDANFYSKYSESERVTNGDPDPAHFSHHLPGLENIACAWFDIPYAGVNPGEHSQSKYRAVEAEKIAAHLKKMLDYDREDRLRDDNSDRKPLTFGVITFYREQVNCINEALAKNEVLTVDDGGRYSINPEYKQNQRDVNEIVRVGTVDAFQGMEFDVVYLSMVRSNDAVIDVSDYENMSDEKRKETDLELQRKYGFLMFENRLCVAMSRQKKTLICVGDSKMLEGAQAVKAVDPLVAYYRLCKESKYGKVI